MVRQRKREYSAKKVEMQIRSSLVRCLITIDIDITSLCYRRTTRRNKLVSKNEMHWSVGR